MATVAKRSRMEEPTTSKKAKSSKKKHADKDTTSTTESSDISTDWDVDYYKTDHESDEHWELRRRFMEVHKDKFPEDQMVCLAQAFVNIEFMGCRYPAEIMQRVGELSQEVAKEFREDRMNKLKRTFVTASSAAEQRAKGRSRGTAHVTSAAGSSTFAQNNKEQQALRAANSNKNDGYGGSVTRHCFGDGNAVDLFEGSKYGKFIVSLLGGRNCLRQSAGLCHQSYEELEGEPNECGKAAEVVIGGNVVGIGYGENIKLARAAAHTNALVMMQAHCYTIKLNARRDTIKVEKCNNQVVLNVTKEAASECAIDKKLDASNKGYHIMRLMGWTGGGLGRERQGREDPVGYLLKNNRLGLGSINQLDTSNFNIMLQNYANSDDIRDLQFEPTFTKEDRAALHSVASRFQLRSSSYGTGENRRLIISKKLTNEQILDEVLLNRNEKYCDRYFVQVPELKAHLFPGHTALLELDT